MKQAVAGMMLLDLAVCLALSVLGIRFLRPLMRFLNTPAEIFDIAYGYIFVIFCGITTTIGYNMFASILRAMGNSRTPLLFLIFSSFLNIGLDILFVMVLNMGLAGAAAATVIAQAVSAILCGVYVFRNYREYLPGKEDFRVPVEMLRTLFSMGISMAMMSCLISFGTLIFSRANNLLGGSYIAAYAASRKIYDMMIQPLATIAVANTTFVGQNWGAKKFDRIRTTLRKVLLLEVAWSLFAMGVVFLFGAQLIRFTTGTDDPAMVQNAVLSLRIHFAALPFLGIIFVMRNALQGMGYKVVPILSSCIELVMKFLSASLLIPRVGYVGTCITEPVIWVLMVTFLLSYYFSRQRKIFAEAN